MSHANNARSGRLTITLTLLLITALMTTFLWSSQSHRADSGNDETWVDREGRLHVLQLVLGESSLREAERALKSRSDIALYIYPQGHQRAGMHLEAYFPSIADHSKVILHLKASQQQLLKLEQRATVPHLYPNGVARMNLHPEQLPQLQQYVVDELTLIPSIEITTAMLESRFGRAGSITMTEDGDTHLHFPALGLTATVSPEGRARLHFSNPSPM